MQISSASDYWLLQTQYASQFSQTQTPQPKKAAAQYATVEHACSSGDSYSFSAEALALAQQMLNAARAESAANDAQNRQSALVETRNNAAVRAEATDREQEAGDESNSARGTGGGGSSSGEDIEAQIASLQSQLQTAISSGDAGKAASLQSQIAVLQAQLQQSAA